MHPLAPLVDEPITLYGDLYAEEFGDKDNLPEEQNRESTAKDFFTRIMVGESACDPIDPEGVR